MKPVTKYQKLIVSTGNKLDKITTEHTDYARDNLFEYHGYRIMSKRTTCMECAHEFDPEYRTKEAVCPNCGKNLQIKNTTKIKDFDKKFLTILTTKDNFQIIRYIQINRDYRKNKKAEYKYNEVQRIFIDEKGKISITAIQKTIMSWNWNYILGTKMEYKKWNDSYDLDSFHYPKKKFLKKLRRNGLKNSFHHFRPLLLISNLLINNRFETLFKMRNKKYINMFYEFTGKYYNQIRICAKNNYVPYDNLIWRDYVELLVRLGKDINNPHYICPENLKEEHDKYVELKNKLDLKEKLKDAESKRQFFIESKSKFFDLEISKGDINIKTLSSIKEYQEEGIKMNHCVFSSEYYNKPLSIVLSARINGKRMETVEVSLETFKVIQSRGYDNHNSKYHQEIIDLVNKNSRKIKKLKSA